MPLFEGSRRTGVRSRAGLVRSDGVAPAGQWIIDPSLPGLFDYHFGGWPRSKVVIPQGTIVAIGEPVRDYRTQQWRNTVTIADGTLEKAPFGVAPYNFYRRYNEDGSIAHDLFEGDDFQPSILTRGYLMLPYIPNPADSELVHWGHVTNTDFDFGWPDREIKAGDYLKPNHRGKFTKWHHNKPMAESVEVTADDSGNADLYVSEPILRGSAVRVSEGVAQVVSYGAGLVKVTGLTPNATVTLIVEYTSALSDPPGLIIGQVGEVLTQIPPDGWLQWVVPADEERNSLRDEFKPNPAPIEGGYPYDPEYKWPLTGDHRSPGPFKEYKGIPGLTTGDHVAQTVRVQKFVYPANNVSVTVQLNRIAKIDAGTLRVFLGGTQLSTDQYSLNRTNNQLTVTPASVPGVDTELRVEYRQTETVGTPPGWDLPGSVGAVHVLLVK